MHQATFPLASERNQLRPRRRPFRLKNSWSRGEDAMGPVSLRVEIIRLSKGHGIHCETSLVLLKPIASLSVAAQPCATSHPRSIRTITQGWPIARWHNSASLAPMMEICMLHVLCCFQVRMAHSADATSVLISPLNRISSPAHLKLRIEVEANWRMLHLRAFLGGPDSSSAGSLACTLRCIDAFRWDWVARRFDVHGGDHGSNLGSWGRKLITSTREIRNCQTQV